MKINQARVDLGVVNRTLHDIVRENEHLKRVIFPKSKSINSNQEM